jgi:Tfp pilus assembly protein PilO
MTKTRQWTIFTAVAVLVVLVAGWMLLVKPQSSHKSNLESQTASQEQQNSVLQSQIATLESEQKQLPAQQQALQKFSTQVPSDPSEPTIIRQLSAAASGAGVDLVSLTPGDATAVTASATATGTTSLSATQASGSLVALPIAVDIVGTYPNVESFFQSLEKLPRALLVSGWSLCPDSTSSGSSASSTGSSNVSCTPPATPGNKTLAPGSLGGVLSATVFYAPPGGVSTSTGTATLPSSTTPAPTSTSAATPAPTVASSAPAN